MKGFDLLKVKSAVKTHNKFDLSRTHLTTMDFGEIVPLFVEETVPSDKFTIDANYFSRMAPLVKPTFGKFSFKTVAGFVPYHQIAEDSEAWLAGKTVWEGQTPVQRYISVENLMRVFIDTSTFATGVSSSATYDFKFVGSDGVTSYRKFTSKGKYLIKILNALGYTLSQNADFQTSSAWKTGEGTKKLSAYPLLAFFKLYNDYMSQSQRFNTSALSSLLLNIRQNKAVASKYNNGSISAAGVVDLFNNLFLNYENDYFTSAWQEPNNALGVGESVNSADVPASVPTGASVGSTNYDNILAQSVSTGLNLGQRSLDFLKDFDDWVRRNNYSGSRAVQQIYSRFGIKTDEYRTHYAQVLGTDEVPIQVGDVTAVAQDFVGAGSDKNVAIGDYAGKGIMNGSKQIQISVSDYGIILILGYYTVAPMNAYGYDRRVLRNSPLDYYTPEFDGVGAEAISLGEVYANPIASSADTTLDSSVFGFTERYNSYRYGRDVITGEFRDYHPDGIMNVWHTGRNLNSIREAGNLVAQSTAMNTLPQTDSEYNRMFSVTDGSVNHFYMTAQFRVSALRPMLNLNQVTNLGEGDTVVPRNGNVIS